MIIIQPEQIIVDDDANEARCDGGNKPLGHPVVWYSFDNRDIVECGYCDRVFIKKRSHSIEDEKTSQS